MARCSPIFVSLCPVAVPEHVNILEAKENTMLRSNLIQFLRGAVVLACFAASPAGAADDAAAVLELGAGAKANDAVRRGILAGKTLPRNVFEVRQRLLDGL